MNDIGRQYSRIKDSLYRRYLDYGISEKQFNSRQKRIDRAYDRYERNIARIQGTARQGRGASNYPVSLGGTDNTIKYSRQAYAGTKG